MHIIIMMYGYYSGKIDPNRPMSYVHMQYQVYTTQLFFELIHLKIVVILLT